MGHIADQVRDLENRVENLQGNIDILRKSESTTGEAMAHMILRDYWHELGDLIEKGGIIPDAEISDGGLSDDQIIDVLRGLIEDASYSAKT